MRISISENDEGGVDGWGGGGEQLISRSERSLARLSWSVDNDQRRRSSLIILHLVSTLRLRSGINKRALFTYYSLNSLLVPLCLLSQAVFPFC